MELLSSKLLENRAIKTSGIIEQDKKEEIKKKIENEKKLQEAIRKAKEKGIQTAQMTNSKPLIEQLNYKNISLMDNQRMASLLGENEEIHKIKKTPNIRSEFKELKEKIRQDADQMVRVSEEIVEWQREGQSLKLLANYKPFTKNLQGDSEESFRVFSRNRTIGAAPAERKKKSYAEFNKKGKLPRDIEKIAALEEKNEAFATENRKKSKILSFLPYKETLHDKLSHIFEEDYIEPCSITWDMEYINNPNQDIPYFRELAPYSREIINMKENTKKNKKYDKISIDLLNEGEFLLDEEQLNFEDLMNIISGRISSRLLHKILNRNDIHSLIDENEEIDDDFEEIQIMTEEKYASEKVQGNSKDKRKVSGNSAKTFENKRESKDKTANLSFNSKKPMENSSQNSQNNTVEYTNDPKNFKNLTTKPKKKEDATDFGVQANEYDIYEESRPAMDKTERILKEITDIKEAKENTKQLPKADTVTKIQRKLNVRLEENLIKLLLIIMDKGENEFLEIKDKPEIVKEHIKMLLKNVDKLKGQMSGEHSKPKLLYKFLREYKKLVEENENTNKLSNQLTYASFDNELNESSLSKSKKFNKSFEGGSPNSDLVKDSQFQNRNMGSVTRSTKRKATPGWGQEKKSGNESLSNRTSSQKKNANNENSLLNNNWLIESMDFVINDAKNE